MTKICQKPVIKCSHCPNRELMLLDEEVIRRHLSGAYVVGVYPMLQDETCYFLAVDFDGEHWVDNVFAFRKTCEQEGVPVAVERSRSGNGAHVWMFFKENIPASLARKMGSFLITKTMSNRYQLILVHRKPLLEQWRLQLASFLGFELKDIGQIGAGKDKSNGKLDITIAQFKKFAI